MVVSSVPVLYDTLFVPTPVQPLMPSALSSHWIVHACAPPDTTAVSVVLANLQICVPPLMVICGSWKMLMRMEFDDAWSHPMPVHVLTTLT